MRPGGQRSHGERSRLRRKQTEPWRGSHRSARRRDLYRRSSVRAGRSLPWGFIVSILLRIV